MDANFRIDGEKVFLTPMTLDDAEIFVQWRNSDFVMSRFILREPFTVEGQRSWIKNKVLTDEIVQFVIWDKTDNVRIGSTYLIHIDKDNKKCEYGILLGEESYSGGGRGSEALKLTLDYGFDYLDMYRIYGRILADNMASYKAAQKAGMSMEGIAPADVWIEGKPIDVIFVSKIRRGANE